MANGGLIQVVVLPHIRPSLEEWLGQHGMELFPIPAKSDDLPTFGIGPTNDTMRRFLAAREAEPTGGT
jgi:hypothetical protein